MKGRRKSDNSWMSRFSAAQKTIAAGIALIASGFAGFAWLDTNFYRVKDGQELEQTVKEHYQKMWEVHSKDKDRIEQLERRTKR